MPLLSASSREFGQLLDMNASSAEWRRSWCVAAESHRYLHSCAIVLPGACKPALKAVAWWLLLPQRTARMNSNAGQARCFGAVILDRGIGNNRTQNHGASALPPRKLSLIGRPAL